MDHKDLLGPDGTENNMGGTEQFFYISSHANILTFGTPAAAPVDPDDKYVIATAHTMKTGKKFAKIYGTIDTTELEQAMNGDVDGMSFKPTFKFFHPGSAKALIAFVNRVKNDKVVMLVPLADGTIMQIGSEKFVGYMKPAFKSDKTTGRGKGAEFECYAYQPDIMIYAAAIPLTPGA